MEPERTQYGRCSFLIPVGFEIDEEASPVFGAVPEGLQCLDDPREPVCLTLAEKKKEDESENPKELEYWSGELDLEKFSVSISLSTLPAQFNSDPLEYMKKADAALAESLEGYEVQFCKGDKVGQYPAARGQSSFVSNFLLYRLSVAWISGVELLVATVLTPEMYLEKSWIDLQGFVESVSLREKS